MENHRSDRRSVSHRLIWWWMPAAAVAGAGVILGLTYPRFAVAASRHGLVRVSLESLGARVEGGNLHYGAHLVALTDRDGRLLPAHRLPAGIRGRVELQVQGVSWLAWLPGERQTVTVGIATAPSPQVLSRRVTRPLSTTLVIAFRQPVARLSYTVDGMTRTVRPPAPTRSLDLTVPLAKPGTTGIIYLHTSAESWQLLGRPQEVGWTTVPYLTVRPSTTLAVRPTVPLTVHFSQPLKRARTTKWKLVPPVPGKWSKVNSSTYSFAPSSPSGFGPDMLEEVKIPGGANGPLAKQGSYLAHAATVRWVTAPGSVLRLQELLAEMGYLPVSWRPASSGQRLNTLAAQNNAVYQPPIGTFHWKYPNLPAALRNLWTPGQMTVMIKGAIMQFERVNGLAVDGIAGPAVWNAMIQDRLLHRVSPDGYSYISVTETLPQTLELWVNGKLVLSSPTNTGIPQTPTYLGTYAIFERLSFQIMRGKNPNGVHYADPVHWINYFAGSDGVHGFYRAAYGCPQSLGCVDLPFAMAYTVYHQVHYGTLVTVNPPGVKPWPAAIQVKAGGKTGAYSTHPS
jgi:peptidoglycan hydrolase-like protein with peptidoglycan-binding domain